jgi:hypothetical protein
MWLVKGILFGLLFSVIFTLIYFKGFIGPTREGVATGLSVIKAGLQMSVFWVVLVATILTSCLWAKALHLAFFERQ